MSISLEKWLQLHYRELNRFAKSLDRNNGDDILQTVLAKAVEDRNRCNELIEIGMMRAYVYRSIRNQFVNVSKRKGIVIAYENLPDVAENISIEWRIINENIDRALRTLSAPDQKLFEYYLKDEFSYREVSIETGVSEKWLYKRIEAIKTLVKKEFQ